MTSHYERRRALSHKPRGRTGNGNPRLTTLEIRQHIRALYKRGDWTYAQLAQAFSFSLGTVQRIMHPDYVKRDEAEIRLERGA